MIYTFTPSLLALHIAYSIPRHSAFPLHTKRHFPIPITQFKAVGNPCCRKGSLTVYADIDPCRLSPGENSHNAPWKFVVIPQHQMKMHV